MVIGNVSLTFDNVSPNYTPKYFNNCGAITPYIMKGGFSDKGFYMCIYIMSQKAATVVTLECINGDFLTQKKNNLFVYFI